MKPCKISSRCIVVSVRLWVVVCIFQFATHAQPSRLDLRHLTVEEGLSHNWVKSILKDKQGFMWFGTFNGLNRYDGKNFKIYRINTGNNLSDNFIESLAEDAEGNIWVGTFSGGLNMFNRRTEKFTTFKHDADNDKTISGNKVYAIYPSKDRRLWIGTDAGLDVFDYQQQTFTHYRHDPRNPSTIGPGLVSTIFADHDGDLWIGTDKGLNFFDPEKNRFTRYLHSSTTNSPTQHYVKSIYEDKYGNIWIGTWGNGLMRFDKEHDSFEYFKAGNHHDALNNNSVISLTGDEEGQLYIGTEGGGLNILDIHTRKFSHHLPSLSNPRGLKSNSIHTLYYDPGSRLLWIGSYNGGVNYYSKWDKPFIHYQASEKGLSDNHITCIDEDEAGNLWIGTDGGGVNYIDQRSGEYRYLRYDNKDPNSLMSDAVLSILCDSKNNVWIGTFNGGLDRLDRRTNTITHFRFNPDDPTALGGEHVSALYEDRQGNIWVGTMTGGLHLHNTSNGTFTRFAHDPANPRAILDNFIIGIYEDRQSGLLIQTGKGLEVFDYKSRSFERFSKSFDVNFDVPNAVLEDRHGNLWIGSQEIGLFKITRPANKVTIYTDKNGLPSNSISGILEDNQGNLWISTLKGLCKFENALHNTNQIKFQVYSVEDGLQASEFKPGAYCKKRNGFMVFGGQNGFNVFDPTTIKDNPFIPPVKITGFRVFTKNVDFTESPILDGPINELESITLTHKESVFTFEFAALNYMLPEKNQYAYMLENFDTEWNHVGYQTYATYTNLDAGDYVFRVKASNNDGVWNETGTALKITVLPPWWNSTWFRFLLLTTISGAAVTFYKIRTHQLKKGKKELEHQVSIRTSALREANAIIEERHEEIRMQNESLLQKNNELEKQASEIRRMAEEIKALNEVKLRFFTNISHELRTPLNLIMWPLEEMLHDQVDKEQLKPKYDLMHKHASRLLKLINQLLDFQKIETGTLQLKREQKNILQSVQEIFDSFKDWAQRYHVHYTLESDLEQLEMWYDEDKLEKILSNLLSNAFKYVSKNGIITVRVRAEEGKGTNNTSDDVVISVYDNGKGIPEDQLGLIFNRFYEVNPARVPGTGIGLALVKELVELHDGEITVSSRLYEGTCFEFRLPTGRTRYDQPVIFRKHASSIQDGSSDIQDLHFKEADIHKDNLPLLLVVEDNEDILHYISRKLSHNYQVELARNGKEGVDKAFEQVPDLIISDIMMPELDGFELCRQLKDDERTSHIPIILVTARSGDEAHLNGLAFGADDYITKPFRLNVLQLKIKNALFTRQKLKEQFLKDQRTLTEETPQPAVEDAFLKKAISVVEENLDNSEFGVENFSDYFKMSRRNVLRKLKAITGLSINEFIKNIRLKESHKLLLKGDMNVAEVAYSVGFNDQKYFSKCFKEHFGKSPSEIIP